MFLPITYSLSYRQPVLQTHRADSLKSLIMFKWICVIITHSFWFQFYLLSSSTAESEVLTACKSKINQSYIFAQPNFSPLRETQI